MSTLSVTKFLRPIEPVDADAVRALCTSPNLCGRAGTTPFEGLAPFVARLGNLDVHRLGLFRSTVAGPTLVGMTELEFHRNLRCRHVATLRLVAATAQDAAPLLDAVTDLAWGWLNVDRIETELPADDDGIAWLCDRGAAVEYRKRDHRHTPSGPLDTIGVALLRPGFSPPPPVKPHPAWSPPSTNSAPVTLRRATADDAPAFVATFREPSVRWGTMQVASTTEALWRARLANPGTATMVVAERGGVIVGHAGLHPEAFPCHRGAIVGMTVREAAQGGRVGRALLDALVDAARWQGIDRLGLEVYPDNTRAIALYRRFGFAEEGLRRAAVWRDGEIVDSLVMGMRPVNLRPDAA